MASLGFRGSPSLAEPKQVNFGATDATLLWSGVKPGAKRVLVVPLPSTWHELQLPLPSNSSIPDISSEVNVDVPLGDPPPFEVDVDSALRNASKFDEKARTSGEASYWSREFPQ